MSEDVQLKAFQERLVGLEQEIDRMGNTEKSVEGYFRTFLERLISVLGIGGGIWQVSPAGELVRICHMNLSESGLDEDGVQAALLGRAIEKTAQSAGPVVLPGKGASNVFDGGMGEAGVNESPNTLLFVPVVSSRKVAAVLLLISPPQVDPRAVRGYLGFLMGLCEKAGVFLQQNQILVLDEQLQRARRIREFISSAHSSLDPRRTCYALANYGQELLGVYRCMAGTYNSRGKFRMESVSGLESVAVKSSFVRGISEVSREVCRNDKILLVDQPEAAQTLADDEDDLITAARVYMLQAGSLVLGVFPIHSEERVVGAFVVEKAKDEPIDQEQRRQIESLLTEVGSALAHSMQYRNLPFSPLVRGVGALRDKVYRMNWPRKVIWGVILAIIMLSPILVPMQVKVVGTAELVPIDARFAYVGQDGIIEELAELPADRMVQQGDVLGTLDTQKIDSAINNISNKIAAMNLQKGEEILKNPDLEPRYEFELSALRAELKMYELQKQDHQIIAPIDGMVITRDDVMRQLLARPVRRGEPILEIVPSETPWQLTVNVSEDKAGELLKAYQKLDKEKGETLKARVILNAYPQVKFESEVIAIARRAFVLESGEQKYRNVIEVRVAEPKDFRKVVDPREGLKGKVAIECGERPMYYAVTHEFVDFMRVSFF
ncbi:MAG: HlyD family efflux transporter periplasmic adaptor subunit [Sedimentisphaerales bacterium]|nr:HlyD family efflux transporter periplasmic adaptor subunit [Sedimentisphaerales bacterium]